MSQYNEVLAFLLYFPEDKTEYIPAVLTFLLFVVGAFFTYRYIVKISQNEQRKVEELYKKATESAKEE
jgi:hypothetical protein